MVSEKERKKEKKSFSNFATFFVVTWNGEVIAQKYINDCVDSQAILQIIDKNPKVVCHVCSLSFDHLFLFVVFLSIIFLFVVFLSFISFFLL
jgi:hypothetical protein